MASWVCINIKNKHKSVQNVWKFRLDKLLTWAGVLQQTKGSIEMPYCIKNELLSCYSVNVFLIVLWLYLLICYSSLIVIWNTITALDFDYMAVLDLMFICNSEFWFVICLSLSGIWFVMCDCIRPIYWMVFLHLF